MKIMRLNREQVRIAKGLGVPIRPLTKKEKMQLVINNAEKNYWLLFIICTWLLLIVSIVIWK